MEPVELSVISADTGFGSGRDDVLSGDSQFKTIKRNKKRTGKPKCFIKFFIVVVYLGIKSKLLKYRLIENKMEIRLQRRKK